MNDYKARYRAARDAVGTWKALTYASVLSLLAVVTVSAVEIGGLNADLEAAESIPAPMPEVQVVEVETTAAPTYYKVPLSHFQQDLVRIISNHYGLDMRLPLAVMQQETRFQNLVGDDGQSMGYMQVQPKWHRERMERLGVSNLMEFYDNTLTGCDFLAELLEDKPLANALAYYNSGGSAALPNDYAESVMDIMESLEVEYETD